MKKILGIAIIAAVMLGGALVIAQPTQAQEPPPPPILPCDPEALVFPCTETFGNTVCWVFAFGSVCFTTPTPAPAPAPAPADPLGPLSDTIGDPQPWTDEHADWPPAPFGPGGER